MKKTVVLLALIWAAAAGYAHEKGDLTLKLDPQIGMNIPPFDNATGAFLGFDFALKGNVHYYFAGFFSVNAGLGVGGSYNKFYTGGHGGTSTGHKGLDAAFGTGGSLGDEVGDLFALYFSIPFGVSLSIASFSLGAGLTGNIPLKGDGSYNHTYSNHDAYGSKSTDTYTFNILPYMGWYIEVGWNYSEYNLFSYAVQVSDSFDKNTAQAINQSGTIPSIRFDQLNFLSITFILRINIPLANLPIGGK